MEYSIKKEGEWVTLSIVGSINFETLDELKSVFDRILLDGTRNLRMNLKNVPVLVSSGISAILLLYKNLKNRDGTLEIRGINKNLLEMFRLVNIDGLIKIEEEE